MSPANQMDFDHRVMVISDSHSLTETIERSLGDEFGPLSICSDPEHWADEFSHVRPGIVVLAFEQLDLAIKCKGIIETTSGAEPNTQFIVLCDKKEVDRAYTLCCQHVFNNYVVYWPISFDPPRLKMALVQAKIALEQTRQDADDSTRATDARLNTLGNLLNQHFNATNEQLSTVNQLVDKAEVDFDLALEEVYRHLLTDKRSTTHSATRVDREQLRDYFKQLLAGFDNIKDWSEQLNQATHHNHQIASALYTIAHKKRSILVVDDDDFQRSVIRQILKDEPYQLNFARTGEEALEILARVSPNLILMDVMMPGIDGIEATRRISTHPQFQHIPVVMVTSHNERDVVIDCLKAGAVDFLVKPYNRNTLLEKIRSSLRAI